MVAPVTITLHPYLMGISGSGDANRIGRVIGTIVENLFLLGPQSREGSIVMPIVLVGVFAFNTGTFAHKPFEIVGRARVMVTFGVVSAAANLVGCFVLIPQVSHIGAAYATLMAYVLYTVGVGALGRRLFPWRIDVRRVAVHGGIICGGVAAICLLRAAMGGLPYLWGLAVTVLASCVLVRGSCCGCCAGWRGASSAQSPCGRSSPGTGVCG